MEQTAEKVVDLSKLSAEDLRKELERREGKTKELRTTYKKLVNDLVPGMVNELFEVSASLSEAKANIFNQFKDIIEMKNEAYNVTEDQQSHTFTSTCGKTIIIGFRTNDGWDDTHSAGIAKVNKVLEGLAKDESSAILVKGIFKLLKKDDKGNLKQSRIIELKSMAEELKDAEFIDAVDIILKSHRPMRSNWFVEAYYKNESGVRVNIPLALSAVDFPKDFKFDFFNSNSQDHE